MDLLTWTIGYFSGVFTCIGIATVVFFISGVRRMKKIENLMENVKVEIVDDP